MCEVTAMRPSFCFYLSVFGFRHAMRDRMRAASRPSEMIDQMGGWSKRSVREGYGEGFTLDNIRKQMELLNSIEGEG